MKRGAGLLALALVAGACGSGGDDARPPEPTTTLANPRVEADVPPLVVTPLPAPAPATEAKVSYYPVPAGSRPHDVAPAPDGSVWYTAQSIGELGKLNPATGAVTSVKLGAGSAPHGVIVGPDGAAWVTDGGLNAIVRVDGRTNEVRRFPLPAGTRNVNMNTAAFGRDGILWFTGQSGFYGRVDPRSGQVDVFTAPRGAGPYGITATPAGEVFYASLAGSHIARVDTASGDATPIDPPTTRQGARRVWSDSGGKIWVSEWNAGQVGVYDPATGNWREWKLPGGRPQAYAVYVDEKDRVWLSDFGANALVMFDPKTEQFRSFPSDAPNASVRQILGRPGEVWGAESGADRLVVVRGA
jgi:virginiamycin B lyase